MSTVYLLVEVSKFAACIAEEELALDPYGEAEDVNKKQHTIENRCAEIAAQDQAPPWGEELHLPRNPEEQREKN